MDDLQVSPTTPGPNVVTDDAAWWDQNRDAVEAKFIGMLMAETTRKPYTGPERRSRATVVLDPADVLLAQTHAQRLGVAYEDYVRRIFHQAILAENQRHLL
jgi:hypothetical protein